VLLWHTYAHTHTHTHMHAYTRTNTYTTLMAIFSDNMGQSVAPWLPFSIYFLYILFFISSLKVLLILPQMTSQPCSISIQCSNPIRIILMFNMFKPPKSTFLDNQNLFQPRFLQFLHFPLSLNLKEAQLMLTTGSTPLAVSRGQQTWYHSTCYI